MKRITVIMIGGLAALGLATPGQAQETVNGGMVVLGPLRLNGTQAAVDFTAAGSTAPVKTGTLAARPGVCTVGQMYFATDATAGQNLSLCTLPANWTIVVGALGGGGVNSQSGTSYTMADTDVGKLVTFNNASPVAVTLPRAGGSSWFVSGWLVDVENQGAGAVTITPITSTIDGAASLTLGQNGGVRIVSDGTNYFTQRGTGSGVAASGSANQILATPNGSGGAATLRALVGADLPLPGPSSLGGVQSKDCSSIGALQKINTDGTVTCAAAGSGGGPPSGSAGGALTGSYPNPGLSANLALRQIEATFDGSGSSLVGGATFCKAIGYAGTIQSVVLTAAPAGSATVDILTDPSYAHFAANGSAGATSITASGVPTISSSNLVEDTALNGWTTPFSAKTVFCFKLSNPAGATTVTATLMVTASN